MVATTRLDGRMISNEAGSSLKDKCILWGKQTALRIADVNIDADLIGKNSRF